MNDSYTASKVIELTGVTYQTLNYWAKIGLVKPSISDAKGSGTRRVYDFADLAAIQIALKLRKQGIFGRALARVLEVLRTQGFESYAQVAVRVTNAGDVVVTPRAGQVFSARKSPGQLLIDFDCDFSGVVVELKQRVRKTATEHITPRANNPVSVSKKVEVVRKRA